MYSDESLQKMTESTGMPFALKYNITDKQYENLDNFKKSLWRVYKSSMDGNSYVTPMSSSMIFMNNTEKFSFKTTNKMFSSVVDGIERSIAYEAFTQYGVSVEKYFTGMWITPSDWNSKYLK